MGRYEVGTYTVEDLWERLRWFEAKYGWGSEDFLERWESGDLPYSGDFFVWAGLCHRLLGGR